MREIALMNPSKETDNKLRWWADVDEEWKAGDWGTDGQEGLDFLYVLAEGFPYYSPSTRYVYLAMYLFADGFDNVSLWEIAINYTNDISIIFDPSSEEPPVVPEIDPTSMCHVTVQHIQDAADLWRHESGSYDCNDDDFITVEDIMCWARGLGELCP